MRLVGLFLSLLVVLLSTPSWAVQRLGIVASVATFTRPADTTTYASGDLVADTTTAASVTPLSWNIVTPPKGGAFIRRVNIRKTSTGVVAPNFRLHLFTTSPTSAVGDNGVYSSTSVGWFCDMDVNMFTTDPFSDGNAGIGVPNNGAECAVVPTASTIYGLLEARGAYVPTNSEAFTVTLEVYGPGVSGGAVATAPGWIFSGAQLDYDFANQRYWNSGNTAALTTTRASKETCVSSNGFLTYVDNNIPCITDLGLAVWETHTNLLLQSNFAATWTATASTLTANVTPSPDGSSNAASLVEDSSATTTHLATQSVTKAASALTYACSGYAKQGTRTRVDVEMQDGSGNGAIAVFDLAGGQVGVAAAGEGTPFTNLQTFIFPSYNGFYRVGIVSLTNTATTIQCNFYLDSGSGTAAISNSYTGNGASGAYLFGAQLELSQTAGYVTPLIPTTTVAVARASDAILVRLTSPPTTAYTLYVKGVPTMPTNYASHQIPAQLDDGTNNNRLGTDRATATSIPTMSEAFAAGLTLTALNGSVAWAKDVAGTFAVNSTGGAQRGSFNGTTEGTGARGTATTLSTLRFSDATPASFFNGTISRVAIFNSLMSAQALSLR